MSRHTEKRVKFRDKVFDHIVQNGPQSISALCCFFERRQSHVTQALNNFTRRELIRHGYTKQFGWRFSLTGSGRRYAARNAECDS